MGTLATTRSPGVSRAGPTSHHCSSLGLDGDQGGDDNVEFVDFWILVGLRFSDYDERVFPVPSVCGLDESTFRASSLVSLFAVILGNFLTTDFRYVVCQHSLTLFSGGDGRRERLSVRRFVTGS